MYIYIYNFNTCPGEHLRFQIDVINTNIVKGHLMIIHEHFGFCECGRFFLEEGFVKFSHRIMC